MPTSKHSVFYDMLQITDDDLFEELDYVIRHCRMHIFEKNYFLHTKGENYFFNNLKNN